MTIALLPIRSLRDGKRRLQGMYSTEERRVLVQRMLRRVVAALADASVIARILLVSPDHELAAWATGLKVDTLLQPGLGMNEGLEYARQIAQRRWPGAPTLVVLPDLPLIEVADIDAIVGLGTQKNIVVAPDRHGEGTNALWLPASAPLPFAFGEGSFQRHRQAAVSLGLTVRCYHSLRMALDIDTPADLELACPFTQLMPGRL